MTDQPISDESRIKPDNESDNKEADIRPAASAGSTPVERLIARGDKGEVSPAEERWPQFSIEAPRDEVPGVLVLFFGVILPLITLGVELFTRMCARDLFDPMPTYWHSLLVAMVPAANLMGWFELRKGTAEYRLASGITNGLAIGVSLFYTAVFLPVIPIGIVAIAMAGLGILPLAPPLALIAGLVLSRRLRRLRLAQNQAGISGPVGGRYVWAGLAIALLALLLIELPATVTRLNLQLAASDAG
jgi:hypothetical protein